MNVRHHGNWPVVGHLVTEGGLSLNVYECPICWALTREPMDHVDHHVRYRTAQVGVQ